MNTTHTFFEKYDALLQKRNETSTALTNLERELDDLRMEWKKNRGPTPPSVTPAVTTSSSGRKAKALIGDRIVEANARTLKILRPLIKLLARHPEGLRTSAVAASLKVSQATARFRLDRAVSLGLVKNVNGAFTVEGVFARI